MVTIKDIARSTNCSPTTISFILNDHPLAKRISDATKKKVLEAVKEMGYVANVHARMLRTGQFHNIGILCFDITDPCNTNVLQGITQYLMEKNFFYHVAEVQNDLELLDRYFQMAKSHSIDGIIGIVNSLTIDPAYLLQAIDENVNFISIGRAIPELKTPSILLDHFEGGMLGVQHLHELGHRDILFLIGPKQIQDSKSRWDGVVEACRRLDLPYREELVVHLTDYPATAESGARAIREALDRGIPFTAVFSFDDYTAYGVIQELTLAGYNVPRDISVVGFDDIWSSKAYNPALTTIRQPMMEMGVEGARLAVAAVNKTGRKKSGAMLNHMVFKPELIVRQSTASPSGRKIPVKKSPSKHPK